MTGGTEEDAKPCDRIYNDGGAHTVSIKDGVSTCPSCGFPTNEHGQPSEEDAIDTKRWENTDDMVEELLAQAPMLVTHEELKWYKQLARELLAEARIEEWERAKADKVVYPTIAQDYINGIRLAALGGKSDGLI